MREDQQIIGDNGVQKGFRCSCGMEHIFGAYVKQRWNEEVRMKCTCGKQYFIISGEVGEVL